MNAKYRFRCSYAETTVKTVTEVVPFLFETRRFVKYTGLSEDIGITQAHYRPEHTFPTQRFSVTFDNVTPGPLGWAGVTCTGSDPATSRIYYNIHIGTCGIFEIMKKLNMKWKQFRDTYREWLILFGPGTTALDCAGILGYAKGTIYSEYTYQKTEFQVKWSDWFEGELEKNRDNQAVVASIPGSNVSIEVDRGVTDPFIRIVCLENNQILVAYDDEEQPQITSLVPNSFNVLIDNLTPLIEASFDDKNGSGIDLSALKIVIDGENPATARIINYGAPGFTITGMGCTYRVAQPLAYGSHSVQVNIADKHGNKASLTRGFYIQESKPLITNVTPAAGAAVNDDRPLISALFSYPKPEDIDSASFTLKINGKQIKAGEEGLSLSACGFSYRPALPLSPGNVQVEISIATKSGKGAGCSTVFTVVSRPYNTYIGGLSLSQLESIGLTTQKIYVQKTGGDVSKIQDLIFQDPRALSALTGIALRSVIDHVRRSRIVCYQLDFARDYAEALKNENTFNLAYMDDAAIGKLDPSLVGPRLAMFRDSIDLLFVCLDDNTMKTMLLKDLV